MTTKKFLYTLEDDKWFYDALHKSLRKMNGDKLTEQDVKKLQEVTENVILKGSELLVVKLKDHMPKMLRYRRKDLNGFENRLYLRWKEPIDLLESVIVACYELGEEFNRLHRKEAIHKKDFVFDALTRLHARACQISFEILTLLKAGFADGAHARWRSLHEIAATCILIKKGGDSIAKRYLFYEVVDSYIQLKNYNKMCKKLRLKSYPKKSLNKLRQAYYKVLRSFGKDFKRPYGWVPASLRNRYGYGFNGIEKAAGLSNWRPYYKMASFNVHAESKGLSFTLGNIRRQILLAGPSNYGLIDPGQSTAVSLYQITTELVSLYRLAITQTMALMAIDKLIKQASISFVKVQKQIKHEESLLRRTMRP